MFSEALAEAMVRGGGIGLAQQIEKSLTPRSGSQSAPDPTFSLPAGPAHAEISLPPAHAAASSGGTGLSGTGTVTSGYGWRADPFDGHLARHAGVDLAGPEGATIRAAGGGVVRRAGYRGAYGNAVEIDHGNGVSTLYAHASALLVADGQHVDPGQAIARVGQTGRATGAHVHFEVRAGGKPVDPERALKAYELRADGLVDSGS